jgi:hypothetical protein
MASQRHEQQRTTADHRVYTFVLQCGRTVILSGTEAIFGIVLDVPRGLLNEYVAIQW